VPFRPSRDPQTEAGIRIDLVLPPFPYTVTCPPSFRAWQSRHFSPQAVEKAGYQTTAKNFYSMVSVALRGKEFRRPARGVYILRDKPAAGRKKPKKAVRKPSEQAVQPAEAVAQPPTGE
jgi:hypothetical protein